MNKDIHYYMNLRYRIQISPDETDWVAEVPELYGCIGVGDTVAEALQQLEEAKQGWFTSRLQHGDPIPEPSYDKQR